MPTFDISGFSIGLGIITEVPLFWLQSRINYKATNSAATEDSNLHIVYSSQTTEAPTIYWYIRILPPWVGISSFIAQIA